MRCCYKRSLHVHLYMHSTVRVYEILMAEFITSVRIDTRLGLRVTKLARRFCAPKYRCLLYTHVDVIVIKIKVRRIFMYYNGFTYTITVIRCFWMVTFLSDLSSSLVIYIVFSFIISENYLV